MISENMDFFVEMPVEDWSEELEEFNPSEIAYRIRIDWDDDDDSWSAKVDSYLAQPTANKTVALVIGRNAEVADAESAAQVVQTLVSARDRLPNLKAVFIGDLHSEESEISWIVQTDMSSLLNAYPNLEHFGVRGGDNLSFGRLKHDKLKTLIVEAGGLPPAVVHEIAAAELPQLEHLEIWLGSSDYGGDATIEDVAPFLTGKLFPKLKYLGIKNTELADALAEQYLTAPILDRLEVLDLSMSILTDEGAKKLIENPRLKRLKKLDVHYNFISEELREQLQTIGTGIEVDASDPQEADVYDDEVYRYVACAE